MNNPTKEEYTFIGYLKWLLEQDDRSAARAAMAHLRYGLSKPAGAAYEMDRYVLSHLPGNANPQKEDAYYLVASLFACWHQGEDKAKTLDGERSTERNLGRSLRDLVDVDVVEDRSSEPPNKKREKQAKRLEPRFNALLEASSEDLSEYLRQAVSLLKSKAMPVNWSQLLHDIQGWNADSRFVQHEWAKGFWVNRESTDDNPQQSIEETKEE